MPPRTAPSPAAPLLSALFCLLAIQQCTAQSLKSLISLSQKLEANNTRTSAVGSVNIIETGGDDAENIPVCYLPFVFPFSVDVGDATRAVVGGYENFAALSLALEHLNAGDGRLVPELDGLHERCPLRFYSDAFDTRVQQAVGLDHIIELTDPEKMRQRGRPVPCAIFGAGNSRTTIPTSIISSSRGFPQIDSFSTSIALDDKQQHPLFGRTIPSDHGTALSVVAKLRSWDVRYVAILHVNDAYGNAFADGVRRAALAEGINVTNVNLRPDADDAAVSDAVRQLGDTGYTFFFGIVPQVTLLDRVMEEAVRREIAGTGRHNWFIDVSVGSYLLRREYPAGSPLARAYAGSGSMSATGGTAGFGKFDGLSSSLRRLTDDGRDLEFLNQHLPRDYPEGMSVNHSEITGRDTFLSTPNFIALFLYDAVVGMGLAACGLASSEASDASNGYFTGEELYWAWLKTTFQGTSGLVDIDHSTGTRKPRSARFALYNYVVDEDSASQKESSQPPQVRLKRVVSELYQSGEWIYLEPYTFNDGTHHVPADLPPLVEHVVRLNTGMVVLGSVLCCIVMGLAIATGLWTYCNRDKKVVRASQPIFLYIISAGTLLMGASFIPLTVGPERAGACMAFPWLLTTGFSLIFSALFTKTHRIKKIMESAAKFKRIKLTPLDVMKPMITLLFLNIVVLTVWTVVDPHQKETIIIERDEFGRVEESVAVCRTDHYRIYVSVLSCINLGSVVFALIMAYQARNISTEFNESRYIFSVMSVMLYASLLAIPILVVARDNVDAYYFAQVGLAFVICSSIFLLIFLPKVLETRKKDLPQTAGPTMLWQTGTEVSERASGIQIYSVKDKQVLERENHKLESDKRNLKQLCMTLSGNHGLDYDSSGFSSYIEDIYNTTDEEGMTRLLAFAKEV